MTLWRNANRAAGGLRKGSRPARDPGVSARRAGITVGMAVTLAAAWAAAPAHAAGATSGGGEKAAAVRAAGAARGGDAGNKSSRAVRGPAAVDRPGPPVAPPAPPLQLPRIQVVKLGNGLEVAVVEMHKAPVVDVTLYVHGGAVRDPEDLPGLATFTAGMLDEGAGKRTALEIAEEVDYLGATLTTAAGPEMAQVNLHVARSRLAAGLDLMADVALHPTFADSEITRQRDLRRTALLQLHDQPTAIAPIAFNAVVYGEAHPYGRPAGGTEVSTPKLDRARVMDFYATYYRPESSRLLVVGDITPAEAKELLAARFGAWAHGQVPPLPTPGAPAEKARAFYLVDKPGAAQSVVRIGLVGVPRSTPDYYALQVMNTILGGSFTSRLNQNLRETHGYTYGASSLFEMRRLAGPFRAAASVHTAATDSSVAEFLKELRRMRAEPVPEPELAKAKAYLGLGLPGEFETTAGAAAKFGELLSNDLPLDAWEHYMAGIQAVTSADVQRVARQRLDDEHLVMLIVGDRGKIEDGLRTLNEGPILYRDLWGAELKP
jgi:predicted Zn-dependent peptidase